MSTALTSTNQLQLRNAKPSFTGLVSGEIFKVLHQRVLWVLAIVLFCFVAGPHLIVITTPNTRDQLTSTLPDVGLHFLYSEMYLSLALVRVFIGIYLLILTSYVIGLEYQLGTIRLLIGRGVGKLQLLSAKVTAIAIIALMLLAICLLLSLLAIMLTLLIVTGNLDKLNLLTGAFWSNTWLYIVTVLISMGVTILMAVAMNVIGRSLSFGLSASLGYFPVDNVGVLIIAQLGFQVTHADFWKQITAYMLGMNLNHMPAVLLPADAQPSSIGIPPTVPVDAAHTLWVALIYAIVFVVISLVLMSRRDIKE